MDHQLPILGLNDFCTKYCEKQNKAITDLKQWLSCQREQYHPDGWMLLECQVPDSPLVGEYSIVPFGPNNTYQKDCLAPET
jgi:hypothetical protein